MKQKWIIAFLIMALALGLGELTLGRAAPENAPLEPQGSTAPTLVSYQGRVQVSGAPFTGTGYFKFAIVNQAGNTTYWSNDGSSSGGSEPTNAVSLPVSNGLFTVLLGDTSLAGMTQQLMASVFSGYDRYLRVWFRAGGSGSFTRLTPDTPITAVPYALQAQHAAPPGNVVIVAKSNGDFTSIQAAINSITASASSPYLVWVGPGWYNETVTLKPYVHLQGAGQGVTFIQASASSGVVLTLSSDTSMHDLNVSNIGSGATNYGIYGNNVTDVQVSNVYVEAGGGGATNIAIGLKGNAQVTLENVTAFAGKTGGDNIGLRVAASPDGGPEITVHGGTFTGSGGTNAYGIRVQGGLGTFLGAADVRAYGQDASHTNIGLYNSDMATVVLQGGVFLATGGTVANGMYNDVGGHLEAEGVTVQSENTTDARALLNKGRATLRGGSYIANANGGASAKAIYNTGGSTTILEAYNVTAGAAGGETENYGLLNEIINTVARVYGSSFTARGGSFLTVGLYNIGDMTLQGVAVMAENGNSNYGLSASTGTVRADSCHFKGTTAAVRETGGNVYLAVSQLDGGMQHTGGTRVCYGTYDNNYSSYSCP